MPNDLSSAPFLDQYFGLWMYEPGLFWNQFELLRKCDLHFHLQSDAVQQAQANAKRSAQVENQIATIQISGKMMKQESSMGGGTSTVAVRRQVREAMNNADVSAVMIHIDSGGGTAAGTEELANDVAALAKVKPVAAFIEDLGASAAYWVASQADRISTNAAGMVGSIGTYGVVHDMSGKAAMEGIKAYVINSGKFKGMGTPGTEVTQEHLAEWQRNVDSVNARFLQGVARGRKMTIKAVEAIADGRVHIGKEALSLGLVDSVESYDAAFQRLRSSIGKNGGGRMLAEIVSPETNITSEETQMSSTNQAVAKVAEVIKPVAATSKEIKAACPGCSSDFVLSQIDNDATLAEVKDAWGAHLQAELTAERAKSAEKDAEATRLANELEEAKKSTGKSGVAPVSGVTNKETTDGGDAVSEWGELIAGCVKGGMTPQAATRHCVVNHAEAHAAYIQDHNAGLQ